MWRAHADRKFFRIGLQVFLRRSASVQSCLICTRKFHARLRDGELKGLGFGVGARYNGRSPAGPDSSLNVPSYTLLDAVVHYETGPWRFSVNATNLSDREYIAGCYDATRCIFGNGRVVTGTATYHG